MNYAQQQRSIPRRLVGFLVVILLHAVVAYVLITGSARQAIEVLRQPLVTKIIEEVKPPELPPTPPPPPKFATPPPPFIPLPEIQIKQPPPPPTVITAVTNTKPAEPVQSYVAPPKAEPVKVAPVIDAAHSCQKPEYPAISRRNEETGTVLLEFLIEVDGKVVNSKVVQSSGHARLDEAARQALSLCNFKPGTVDGKPERSTAHIRYTWTLD